MITGQDLVEWQLRIASGEELPIKDQSMIPCIGHAMEARIYAENPAKDFLPVTGNVWHHSPPVPANLGGDTVRVDTGIEAGDNISVYYDPMVSKLIVHGRTREEARKRLIDSLKNYQIAGVPSNIPFLIKCAQHPVFAEAGAINTGFLEEYADDVKIDASIGPVEQAVCALVASLALENRVAKNTSNAVKQTLGPWSNSCGSWRLGMKHQRLLKPVNDTAFDGELPGITCTCNRDGSFDMTIVTEEGVKTLAIDGIFDQNNQLQVVVDKSKRRSFTAIPKMDKEAGTIAVNIWPTDSICFETEGAVSMVFEHPLYSNLDRFTSTSSNEGCGSVNVRAPMPGKIARINFKEGDSVNESDVLIVMESMKMEHAVVANMAGFVSQLYCSVGDIVNDSDVLAVVAEEGDESKIASS